MKNRLEIVYFFLQKIQARNLISNLILWCRYPESNRDGLLVRRILSPVRLPVPPYLHKLLLNNNYYNIIQRTLSRVNLHFNEKITTLHIAKCKRIVKSFLII